MPASIRPLLVLALLVPVAMLSACGSPQARTAHYMDRGQGYLAEGKLDKARLEFRNALQISPNNAEVRYQNGLVEEKLENYKGAAQLFQATLEVDKTNDHARIHLARLYLFSGAADHVAELLQPGLDAHPDNYEMLTLRAAARSRLNDIAGALTDAERAVHLAPADEAAISTLAGLYNAANRVDDARTLLEGGLEKLPSSVDLREVLAQFYVQHSQNDKAEQVLKDLRRLQPKEKSHFLALARFYVANNRLEDGERVLREAIAAFPKDNALPLALVDFLATRRSRDAAEHELAAIVATKPEDFELQLALGRFYEQGQQVEKAEALYRKIIGLQDKKPAALTARDRIAGIDLQRNDVAGARKLITEVLEANPRDSDALLMRSELALAAGDAKTAIVDLRAVVRDQPNSVPLLRQLARAYVANGDLQLGEDMLRQAMNTNPADNTARADLAQFYLQRNRPDQARPLADELVKQDPKNPQYRNFQFRAAASTKDYEAASAAAAAMRNDHPEIPDGWYFDGLLAEAKGRPEDALRNYAKALEIRPQSQEPLDSAVKLLLRQKKTDSALELASNIAAKAPDYAFPVNLRGELLLALKRDAEAGAAFTAATKIAPNWWLPYRNLAYVQLNRKDEAGAVKLMRDAAEKLQQPEPLVGELALLLQRLGRNDEAISAYEALLHAHPQSEFGANNLAMLLVTTHSEPASLSRARELVTRLENSKNPSYLDTNGWVLLRHGEASAAVPVLEKALTLAPDAAIIRFHLALAQYSAGNKQSALDNLQRAVNAKQNFDGLDVAQAKLAEWTKAG